MTAIKSVLDKTALLGLLRGDFEVVLEDGLASYAVSAITISDLLGDLIHDHEVEADTAEDILDQGYAVVPCDRAIAELAARLRPLTAHRHLTIADRCCIATAKSLGTSVTTGTKEWGKMQIAEVDIHVLNKPSKVL